MCLSTDHAGSVENHGATKRRTDRGRSWLPTRRLSIDRPREKHPAVVELDVLCVEGNCLTDTKADVVHQGHERQVPVLQIGRELGGEAGVFHLFDLCWLQPGVFNVGIACSGGLCRHLVINGSGSEVIERLVLVQSATFDRNVTTPSHV